MRTPLPTSIPTVYPTTTHTELNRDRNFNEQRKGKEGQEPCDPLARPAGRSCSDPLAPVEIGVDEWRHVRVSFKAALFGFSIVKCQSAAGAGSGCH